LPELPEVETVRRGLAPAMEDATFKTVEQRRPDLRFPFPDNFTLRITGSRLLALRRRAKYLCGYLSTNEVLIMHLGMSGRFHIDWPDTGKPRRPDHFFHNQGGKMAHDHVVFTMSNGARILYNDARRFGFMDLVPAKNLNTCRHFSDMGVEPLSTALNATYIAKCAARRKRDLKAFLLDQSLIAGLGNIYVCEILHRAGLSPKRQASCLAKTNNSTPSGRATRLVPIIQDVLNEAIAAGGSTLRDYAGADGTLGYFQHAFRVYGREGEACVTKGCAGTVSRITQGGRSTFYCGHCQR